MRRTSAFSVVGITAGVVVFSSRHWPYAFGPSADQARRIEFWALWGSLHIALITCALSGLVLFSLIRSKPSGWWQPVGILCYLSLGFAAAYAPLLSATLARRYAEQHSMDIFSGEGFMAVHYFTLAMLAFVVVTTIALGIGLYACSPKTDTSH